MEKDIVNILKLDKATQVLREFVNESIHVLGDITLDFSETRDIASFPSVDKDFKKSGVYLISSTLDERVIYVGIATNICARIYRHIGSGFSWENNGSPAFFPNCRLASNRIWLSENTKDELQRAKWKITAVFPSPENARKLLESALIFWGEQNGCKPEVNVGY